MRTRLLLVAVSLSLAAVSSFTATSAALSDDKNPRLRPNLALREFPPANLTEAEAVAANNLIGTELGPRVGITPSSYEEARRIATTRVGAFVFVPGSDGGCIVLIDRAASCGDPGMTAGSILALASRGETGKPYNGVVIGTTDLTSVSVMTSSGRKAVKASRGVAVIDDRSDIRSEIREVKSDA